MRDEITYIKLYRKMLTNKLLAKDNDALILFINILLSCDYESGTFYTGRNALGKMCNVAPKRAYNKLKLLEKYKLIKINSTTRYTILTVVNWRKYQQKSGQPVDNQWTTKDSPMDNELYPVDYGPVDNKKSEIRQKSDSNQTLINNKELINNINVPTFKVEPVKEKKKKYSDVDVRLGDKLFSLMKKNHEHITRNPKDGDYNEIRKINSIDGKSYEIIEWIIEWSQKHEFWQNQILSTGKLRKQMDQLMVQAKKEKVETKKNSFINGSTLKTDVSKLPEKEKELTSEQKERGKIIRELIGKGQKLSGISTKTTSELKEILASL